MNIQNTVWPPNRLLGNGVASAWNPVLPIEMGPGKYGWYWIYADKQYGYAWFDVNAEGSGSFWFLFSNGTKFDGDTFNAALVVNDASGNPLEAFEWRAGMNPAGISGGAKERSKSFAITRTPEWWSRVASVTVHYRMIDTLDDAAIWDGVIKVVEGLLGDENSSRN